MTLFESQRDDNEYQNLYEEEILIAVPEAWNLEGAVMEAGKRRPRLPLLALKDRPMILLRKQTTMRPVLDRLFRARQVVPQILFDTANPATILEMVRAGICCGIVAESTAQGFEQGIRYYSFEKPLRWNVAVSYPKGAFLNQAEKLFIQQAREYWMQKAKVQSAEQK